ncbi:MAG: hypothetical protein WC389_22585 [Lutibacter sp.]|jgi:cbb3-type cytochrome oxidase subunit 3
MKKLSNYFIAILAFVFIIWPTKIFAALSELIPSSGANPTGINNFGTLPGIVSLLFNIITSASGLIFIVLFLVGGIQYLFSSGNEEGTGKAKKLLLDSVIGLVIVLSVWAIGRWIILKVFGE